MAEWFDRLGGVRVRSVCLCIANLGTYPKGELV